MPSDTPSAPQPLGLTVHSLPPADARSMGRTRMGRWKMLAVLLVCAAPVIASYFTYYVIRPQARNSFGQLIEPQRPMPGVSVQRADGAQVTLVSLQGQWLLVSASGGGCNARCEEHLYLQRQLRESLGREKERMDWVWLITDGQSPAPGIQAAVEQAQVLRISAQDAQQWLPAAPGQLLEDHLYVVDPQGNAMMRLPATLERSNAGRAKRDLERLLRASASWDQPGR